MTYSQLRNLGLPELTYNEREALFACYIKNNIGYHSNPIKVTADILRQWARTCPNRALYICAVIKRMRELNEEFVEFIDL